MTYTEYLNNLDKSTLPIGGRIFYINPDATGATYTFYDASGNILPTQTVAGLANAVSYKISGTPSADKFYVYDNTTHTTGGKTATNGLISSTYWGYYNITTGATTNTIGLGKTNTNVILAITDTSAYSDSIFKYVKACRDENLNGCNDWFIASMAEQEQLRSSGLVDWYDEEFIWSSVEYNRYYTYSWYYRDSHWSNYGKDYGFCAFAARAF